MPLYLGNLPISTRTSGVSVDLDNELATQDELIAQIQTALDNITSGEVDPGVDLSVVTAEAPDVLVGKIIVNADGAPVVGTMANNGATTTILDGTKLSYSIPEGYHSGEGTVSILTEEKTATPEASEQTITPSNGKVLSKVTISGDADLVAGNIKNGVEIFGVTGTYTGSNAQVQSNKTVTPTAAGLTVSPDSGYDYLAKVTVNGDSDLVASNIKSGVNIFGVTGTYSAPTVSTQEKSITPSSSTQTVTPDSGKYLSKVTVNGDSDLTAANIKSGVNIFGVTGTYVGSTVKSFSGSVSNTSGSTSITISEISLSRIDRILIHSSKMYSTQILSGYGSSSSISCNCVVDNSVAQCNVSVSFSGSTVTLSSGSSTPFRGSISYLIVGE